jgi:hypothetical protein
MSQLCLAGGFPEGLEYLQNQAENLEFTQKNNNELGKCPVPGVSHFLQYYCIDCASI